MCDPNIEYVGTKSFDNVNIFNYKFGKPLAYLMMCIYCTRFIKIIIFNFNKI